MAVCYKTGDGLETLARRLERLQARLRAEGFYEGAAALEPAKRASDNAARAVWRQLNATKYPKPPNGALKHERKSLR